MTVNLTGECVKIYGKYGYECFPLSCRHLGKSSFMQCHTAHQLKEEKGEEEGMRWERRGREGGGNEGRGVGGREGGGRKG